MAVDAQLVADWLAGRSLARGLPPPLPDRGGLRVDTATEAEIARWVFAGPDEAIAALTRAVRHPGYLVKFAGSALALTPLLAPGWAIESENRLMVRDRPGSAAGDLPPGYRWLRRSAGAVDHLRILTVDGMPAASGYAALSGAAWTYDRILTVPDHRRQGLGAALMVRLGALKPSPTAVDVLTATPAGRELYRRLGWREVCSWTTARFLA